MIIKLEIKDQIMASKLKQIAKVSFLSSAIATMLSACTNPVTTAGNSQTYYEGKITQLELIEMTTNRNDTTKNTLLGAVGGALIGNLIGNNSTSTVVGAGLGALAAGGLSEYGQRKNGVRLTIDSDNGPLVVDMPFSCKYAVGKNVRLISGSSQGSIMVENSQGRYQTATEDDPSKCPATYQKLNSY